MTKQRYNIWNNFSIILQIIFSKKRILLSFFSLLFKILMLKRKNLKWNCFAIFYRIFFLNKGHTVKLKNTNIEILGSKCLFWNSSHQFYTNLELYELLKHVAVLKGLCVLYLDFKRCSKFATQLLCHTIHRSILKEDNSLTIVSMNLNIKKWIKDRHFFFCFLSRSTALNWQYIDISYCNAVLIREMAIVDEVSEVVTKPLKCLCNIDCRDVAPRESSGWKNSQLQEFFKIHILLMSVRLVKVTSKRG